MEYPAEKHSLGLKVSIVVSKGGKLTSMQSACDKEFNALLSEMRTCLRENGRDQSLADNAQKGLRERQGIHGHGTENVATTLPSETAAVAHGYSPTAAWPEHSKMIRQSPAARRRLFLAV